MAVNIILGAPGGGKSYEAVAFHLLPALKSGRKVITNLPLVLEVIGAFFPEYLPLIELRQKTLAERPEVDWQKAESLFKRFGIAARSNVWNAAPFSHVEDYGDLWRHPENGSGPLYIIDECHLCLPSRSTPIAVEEWFSLHRHESADVLLISQSHSKINRAVIELVQICYRVRKNTGIGSDKTYRRFVFDGVRGPEVNFAIRKYDKRYFKFYKSHTRNGGSELAAADIVPIWKRPIFVAAGVMMCVSGVMVARAGNPIAPKLNPASSLVSGRVTPRPESAVAVPVVASASPGRAAVVAVPAAVVPAKLAVDHPLASYQIHEVGSIKIGAGEVLVHYTLSRNGGYLFPTDSRKLAAMGYEVLALAPCFSEIVYRANGYKVYASCDGPTQSAGLPGTGSQPGAVVGGSRVSGGEPTTAQPSPRVLLAS